MGNDPISRHGRLGSRIQDKGSRKTVRPHRHRPGSRSSRSQTTVNIHGLAGGNVKQGAGVENNSVPYLAGNSQRKIPAYVKQRIPFSSIT